MGRSGRTGGACPPTKRAIAAYRRQAERDLAAIEAAPEPSGFDMSWNFAEDAWEYRLHGEVVPPARALGVSAREWFERGAR